MKVGLRTEVVVSITLLLGGALLFSGFLMIKLTERGLLDQQRAELRRVLVLLSSAVTEQVVVARNEVDRGLTRVQPALAALGRHEDVLAWRLLDEDLQVLAEMSVAGDIPLADVNATALLMGEMTEHLVYSSRWLSFSARPGSFLDLAVPLGKEASAGALQVRFSLKSLERRVHGAQKLVLFYVLLFGGVLSVFGVWTLNRNVVGPVRRLQQATTDIASGGLQAIEVPHGPKEIRDLAASFNDMVQALADSRAETTEHIASLEETNRALSQARDDLLHSEKMASVGHLSAGMAHEIGNPLGAIVGYLGILRQDLDEPGARELVERSLAEANRIDALIRELLDYASPDRAEPECFDPVLALRETVAMTSHQGVLGRIRIDDRCPATAPQVSMNRGRFAQVFINLLLNARDAMPEGGTLTLSMQRDRAFWGCVLADQGCGMDSQTRKAIFEPFFTTKGPGKGTGLGLSVCQRIVDEAGGRIDVVSSPGEGSSFTVWLPLSDPVAAS